ncbi:protein of unknown function (plasmid) [Cupriavidus taiwanensis]|nr:protein of unknown function [Cupriavidus taiwanensis]
MRVCSTAWSRSLACYPFVSLEFVIAEELCFQSRSMKVLTGAPVSMVEPYTKLLGEEKRAPVPIMRLRMPSKA